MSDTEEGLFESAGDVAREDDAHALEPRGQSVEAALIAAAVHEGGFAADEEPDGVAREGAGAFPVEQGLEQEILAFFGRDPAQAKQDAGIGREAVASAQSRGLALRFGIGRCAGRAAPRQDFDALGRSGRIAAEEDRFHVGRRDDDAFGPQQAGALLLEYEPQNGGRESPAGAAAETLPEARERFGAQPAAQVDGCDVGDDIDMVDGDYSEAGAGQALEIGAFGDIVDQDGGRSGVVPQSLARGGVAKGVAECGVLGFAERDQLTG